METIQEKPPLYRVVGCMSGTSLDGLDLAFCTFSYKNGWLFTPGPAETISFSPERARQLAEIENASALDFSLADTDFGAWTGQQIAGFMARHQLQADFASVHGHTIFHQPQRRLTVQLGDGAATAAHAGLPVVCNFRKADLALGGQGAPLVPLGDHLLFSEYTFCLNLGGIANISFEKDGQRLAWDICPVNMVMNTLAARAGKPFDEGGKIAASGSVSSGLLHKLDSLAFYQQPFPRSLGKEWVLARVMPLLQQSGLGTEDQMATFARHAAGQVAKTVKQHGHSHARALVTGGGAHNSYFLHLLRQLAPGVAFAVPEKNLLEFKEAQVFALLGVLRWCGQNNVLASVTGAPCNHCAGEIHLPSACLPR